MNPAPNTTPLIVVNTFNRRSGEVILVSADVQDALGFYPLGFVTTDATLTGNGTPSSPLSVVGGGGGSVTSFNGRTGAVVSILGDYTTSIVAEGSNLYFTQARAIASPITGYVSGAGVVAATDTILQAIEKLNGNTAALVTGVSSVNSLTGAVPLTGTSNRITVSAANVFDISAAYIGQTSITTLGTITTGVWNGTAIANANLANSSLTIGSTNIALGATSTVLAGLTSVTSTSFVGALTGNADSITVANEATDTTCFIAFWTAASGSLPGKTNTNLTFNSNTGVATFGQTIVGSINGNAATATSAAKWTTARNLAGNSVDGSTNVAFTNKFIVQGTTDAGLSGAQFLGALATGIVKNTTTTGILSIAASGAGGDYVAPGLATSSGLTMSTARLLGRTTAATGAIEEISMGTGVSLSGGVLSATGSGGTVTAVSVATANGFAGSSSGGATPALTITTTVTGILKGNGTAISAAASGTDYSLGTSALGTGILKSTTGTGALTIAIAADFPTLNQNTTGTANIAGGTIGAVPYQSAANTTTVLAATATANKVFMSGASAAPVWSTPTYPNATATSRKIIVGDGTNFVMSTETWAVPGSAGNVLVSDGTNWIANARTGTVNVVFSTTPTITNLLLAAGTASLAPLVYTSGTNLTSAIAGAREYDGKSSYMTNETTAGRGLIPVEQRFRLTAAGGTISTIANYFGTTSNIPLVASAEYEIEIECYFLKTTAGTVTWTFTNSATPTSMTIYSEFSPATGITTTPTANLMTEQYNLTSATPTVVSASLTTAVEHYAYFKIRLINGTGTSLKIQATCSAGTITPGINSYWKCVRVPAANVGAFAA